MKFNILLLIFLLFFSCRESTRFQLLNSIQTGIDFNNTITETDSFHIMSFEYIYYGAGVGIGDLNNDGLQDLVFAGNQVSSKSYLNLGDFKFKDITSNFKGLSSNQWYSGVTIADVNGDGWMDVYLTSTANIDAKKCKNRLWINNGVTKGIGPTFTESAEKFGIACEDQSVNAAFFDYDCDGDLDLYILNNLLSQELNNSYRSKLTDGSAANNDKFYKNNGNNTFTDITKEAGIVYEGFGLGLAVSDVNKDGYPDIYISNDFVSNDILYINQGNGTFKNEIRKYLSYQTKSSMGNDIADVNNDGNPDIITLDMMPADYFRKKQTINGFSYVIYLNDEKYGYEHQYLRNMLHLHNGFLNNKMLPYSEVGQITGIYQTEWSWSPLFADYDNDGDNDLLITTGYPKDMTDKDWVVMQSKVYKFDGIEKYLISQVPSLKVPNYAFENASDLNFINKSKDWLPDIPSYSYGAAFVDLDNDGDLDYITNNLNDQAFVLKNTTMEHSEGKAGFIKIKLKGKGANTMAIGAKVELWSKGNYQYTEHFLTRGYASSVDPVVHFGLSGTNRVDSIKVIWPLGKQETILRDIKANQTLEINESNSSPIVKELKNKEEKKYLFNAIEDKINYVHEQSDFIDFILNQKIIPHKFSQIGPIMVKGDLNNDGLEDFLIGSTNLLPTMAFLQDRNGFKKAHFKGLTDKKEFSESDIAILDIDNDGDNDVIALAGGYENKKEDEYVHYLYENKNNVYTRKSIPVAPFPASVVRPFDFDHDGDLDLFIGARIKKGAFPYSNNSWLLLNDEGKLSENKAIKLDLGMVTDAIWSDYDNDGWEDLIVTREWNSITFLKSDHGKKLIMQSIPEMNTYHGLWYTIRAGDFDQDGDDDYIAGNLGDNHRFTVSNTYPLKLYAVDLNLDGTIDPLTTSYWKDTNDVMQEYPVNYFDELKTQTLYFDTYFDNFKSFSYATINDIIDTKTLNDIDLKLKVTTTSSYILWNNKGIFKWEKLPKTIQLSPLTRMIVKDFNGDKFPDLLMGGNDYTYDISTGYYDANKGYVLLNNGKKQSFKLLAPSESGILLQGMVGSLLYFDGDSPFVIAGFNRGKTLVYKLNRQKHE